MKKTYSINLILLSLITSLNAKAFEFCNQNNELITNSNIEYFEYNQFVHKKYNTSTAPLLSSKRNTNTTINLSWTASSDESGIVGYKVYKDGVLEATLKNVLYYKVTGLTGATKYSFTVKAYNALGIESQPSNILEITTDSVRLRKYNQQN